LLQIIAGTLQPTEGDVQVRGRVAALLELGSGFNPEFTGRENVYLNAALYGLTRAEVDARMADILAFAEIGEFIDQPVRSYSSGMVMRLAFSVIVHVDADILIVDEALAVGDAFFTQKCMRFMRAFKARGTMLFVSHDTGSVTGLCDRAYWLDEGRVRMEGSARDVSNAYLEAFIAEREGRAAPTPARDRAGAMQATKRDIRAEIFERTTLRNDIRVFEFKNDHAGFGDGAGRIASVALLDPQGRELRSLIGGEEVELEIVVDAVEEIEHPIVGFYLKDRNGQFLFGDNTYLSTPDEFRVVNAGQRIAAKFRFDMPRLQAGDYFITAALASGTQEEHRIAHWMHEALAIKAEGQGLPVGIIGLPMANITLESVP
jgi:lipopolysaccharide transport system ATP-binding protein